jgi:hypothetical protein
MAQNNAKSRKIVIYYYSSQNGETSNKNKPTATPQPLFDCTLTNMAIKAISSTE